LYQKESAMLQEAPPQSIGQDCHGKESAVLRRLQSRRRKMFNEILFIATIFATRVALPIAVTFVIGTLLKSKLQVNGN
jgi:hypothetical protein